MRTAVAAAAPAAVPPRPGENSWFAPASRTFSTWCMGACTGSCTTHQSWVPLTSLQHGCQIRHLCLHLWRSVCVQGDVGY
jgi:hypothetical protein